jgi:CDP-glycerol glycerophosphotransferase (TagB/SpsB family)
MPKITTNARSLVRFTLRNNSPGELEDALTAQIDEIGQAMAQAQHDRDRYRAVLEELAVYCGNSDNWHRPVEARAMIEVMIDNALEATDGR